jgi:hypothetical protein
VHANNIAMVVSFPIVGSLSLMWRQA